MRIQIRELVNPGSGIEKIRIRDKHSRSATLHPGMKKEKKNSNQNNTLLRLFFFVVIFCQLKSDPAEKNQCGSGSTTLHSS
jgi:hypothetical protein